MNAYSEKSDAALVELSLLGNEAAYAELVLRHENAVMGTAFKITHNRFSAEDASQDAFLSAWMRLDSIKDTEKFGSWVCSIARNCAISLQRKYSCGIADISFSVIENAAFEDDGDGLLSAAMERERDRELHEAVDSLSEKIREVIRLHYFEGLSVTEIASKLSLPAGTVKWRLSEGRKQLRKGYGIMEETYNDERPLLDRVMKQIEKLKLWRMKADKTGFEPEYRAVLESAMLLEDGSEKESAIADTLLMGYWWLPGEKNKTVFDRIKAAAEAGHNEDVMQEVVAEEVNAHEKDDRIRFLLEEKIPYLQQNSYTKALGFAWYLLGLQYNSVEGKAEEEIEAYRKAAEILRPEDIYRTLAISKLDQVKWLYSLPNRDEHRVSACSNATVIRRMCSKLYNWLDIASDYGFWFAGIALFGESSWCDSLICDENMQLGDSVRSSDGRNTMNCIDTDRTFDTPASRFEGCKVFRTENENNSVEVTFCPGVGIVHLKFQYSITEEITLSEYNIVGGSGLLPLAEGNFWSYSFTDTDGTVRERLHTVSVTYSDGERSVLNSVLRMRMTGFKEDTWLGNMAAARFGYCDDNGLRDVRPYLQKASRLAETKRQKRHTAIATNVMERIILTKPQLNPDYTEYGRWNFFGEEDITFEDGKIKTSGWKRPTCFEWKHLWNVGINGSRLLYSFLDRILQTNAGALWSDAWVPGYKVTRKYRHDGEYCTSNISVTGGETVTTPAGVFENCLRLDMYVEGMKGGSSYFGSEQTYWFAEGVGIVQFSRPLNGGISGNRVENIWQLTEYELTGSGYFPIADGLFRHFEPKKDAPDGWHAYLELLFDIEGDSTVMFRNAYGTQDRAGYEEMTKNK